MNVYAAAPPSGEGLLGRRIGSAVIDFVPLGILTVVIAAIGLGDLKSDSGSFPVQLNGAGTLLFVLIWLGYHCGAEVTSGKSLGKAVLGLRVVAEDGSAPTASAIALRTVLRLVDVLPLAYLVGFIVMLSAKPRGRRLGDIVAKTIVVRGSRMRKSATAASRLRRPTVPDVLVYVGTVRRRPPNRAFSAPC